MYKVYVLESLKDGKRYYGFTADLDRRLDEHNSRRVTSTKSGAPFEIVYLECVATIGQARKREKYFKSGYGRKYIENRLKYRSVG